MTYKIIKILEHARIAWLGGAEINFGKAREVYFVGIREGHGGTRNLSQSGSNEQGEEQRFKGIFRPKSEIQAVFPAENRWSPKQKKFFLPKTSWNPVSVHKKHQFGSPLYSSSPEPVNFVGAQSSLGGAQFSFGGHKQSFGGHGPGMPPRGAGSVLEIITILFWCHKILKRRIANGIRCQTDLIYFRR